jgi:hypothetical protein
MALSARFYIIFFIVSSCLKVFALQDPTIKFLENKSQWDQHIRFASLIPGGEMNLSPQKFSYYFVDEKALQELHEQGHAGVANENLQIDHQVDAYLINVSFEGSNDNPQMNAFGKRTAYYNFFIGNNPDQWASHVNAFKGVQYSNLYNGIDLKVYGYGENVKYDFIVSPGADPKLIRMCYQGAVPEYTSSGDVIITTPLATITEKKPVSFQFINGRKKIVRSEFVITGNTLTFIFPDGYDPCHELVIDPLLIFSTYSGSEADNWGSSATPGENGTLYSSGVTNHIVRGSFSGRFPATPGAFQTSYGGLYDIGILKYDSAGTQLLYASYLGGNASETPHSLVVNNQNDLILLGTTGSANFPTTENVLSNVFKGGEGVAPLSISYPNGSDMILCRISADGSELLASTFLGGTENDGLNLSNSLQVNYGDQMRGDVITDGDGNIYIASVTSSEDFPSEGGFQELFQGGQSDAIIVKIDPALTRVLWGSFIGGEFDDAAYSIKFDQEKNIFLSGGTDSDNFPVTSNSYQDQKQDGTDGWIMKVSSDGGAILASTFTGTDGFDQVYFVDLNINNEVYIYGQTDGAFPVTSDVFNNPNSGQFVQKLDNSLSSLVFSTVFGSGRGVPDISPTAFLVNDCNNLYMTGWGGQLNDFNWAADTRGLPTSNDAFQRETSGNDFYFIVLTDDASQFLYGTYMGGASSLTHVDGGTSRFDKSGVVYHAVCAGCDTDKRGPKSDFPTTPNAWSRTNNSDNCNNAAFKFDLSSLKAIPQSNSVLLDQPRLQYVCIPDPIVFQNLSIGGEKFVWNFGDGSVRTTTSTDTVVHHYRAVGNYVVTLTAYDSGTCKVVDRASLLMAVFNKNMSVQDDDVICEEYPYQLTASGGVNYQWMSSDSVLNLATAQPSVDLHDTTTFHVTIVDANGCMLRDTVTVNVIPSIGVDFRIQRAAACEGRPQIIVTNYSDSLWVGDRFIFNLGDGTKLEDKTVTHNFEKDGVYTIKMTGVREFCTYEKQMDLPVFTIKIPNVITPDGNDKNEVFTIQYGEDETKTPADFGYRTSLIIYNRWGDPVYEQDDYDYQWSGKDLATGIYYFEVDIEEHATCKSWIHLMR